MTYRSLASVLLCALALALAVPSAAQPAADSMLRPRGDGRARVKQVIQIVRSEPSIREVQKAALRHYELEPERMHRLARNARLKGLVPRLSLGLSNSVHTAFRNTRDGLYPILPNPAENPNPESYKERESTSSDELGWSLSATWELDRLAFNGEALDAKSLTSLEENLVREVTTLFFSRRRVLASLVMSPPTDDEEYFYELMRLEELTATLDAFTGGMFSKRAWNWEEALLR